MTKNKKISLLFLLALASLWPMRKVSISLLTTEVKKEVPPHASPVALIHGQTAPAPVQDQARRKPTSVGYVNEPSDDWQEKLESSFKTQAGNSLKNIKIVKEKSLVWTKDETNLMVESVVVTLTNQQDVESSFRALVDSQTGKVLETWDRSIFDPANVREGFRFKLDPRYTN